MSDTSRRGVAAVVLSSSAAMLLASGCTTTRSDLIAPEGAIDVALVDGAALEAPIPPTYDPNWRPLPPYGLGPGGDGPDFGFNGVDFTGWTPPDSEIAVGPDHLIMVTNGAIAFFDKTGALLFQDEIENSFGFWGQQGATGFVFDPECLWDPHSQRFFAMACERSSNNRSFFLLAVSDDANPLGTWHKYRIDVNFFDNDIDSPNMAVDQDVVYLSADFFGPDKYGIIMIDKAPILSGGAVSLNSMVVTGTGNQSFGLPITYDTNAPAQYMIQSSEGTNNGVNFNEVRFHAIEDPLGSPTRVTIDVAVPTYSYPNQPPQQGTSVRPFLFEPRFWSAAYRNGSLWAVHHVNSSRARARWYEFEMNGWPDSGNTPTLRQWGELDYGGGVHTYFPSISVDDEGNAMIVFARSATNEFISIGRAFRRHDDALNTFRPMEFVKISDGPYTGASRWGDYSGNEPEPNIPGVFWGGHEWSPGGTSWRTWFVKVDTMPSVANVTDVEVTDGTLISGGVPELTDSDNTYLVTRSEPGAQINEANLMRAVIGFTATGTPGTLDLTLESRVDNPGGTAVVRIRNWTAGGFDLLGNYPLPTTDGVKTFDGIDASDYVRSSDGRIEIKIKHVVVATFTPLGFRSFLDQASIELP